MMAILGRWNWWLPPRIARVVRVKPSPLAESGRGLGRVGRLDGREVPRVPAW